MPKSVSLSQISHSFYTASIFVPGPRSVPFPILVCIKNTMIKDQLQSGSEKVVTSNGNDVFSRGPLYVAFSGAPRTSNYINSFKGWSSQIQEHIASWGLSGQSFTTACHPTIPFNNDIWWGFTQVFCTKLCWTSKKFFCPPVHWLMAVNW